MRVLVTGSTGYIGGRLTSRLLEEGHHVRLLVRDPARVAGRPWVDRVEIVCGDLLEPDSIHGLCDDLDVAYYLVHAMYAGKDFARRDRLAAEYFCAAAPNLKHVIYLGGLLPRTGQVSKHLASRSEIGRILAARLPTTELRAGPIIGSGSASFEMIRYLTERLPVMPAPSWVNTRVQPIAVRDVLFYLAAALERGSSGIVEIGSEPLTYRQMIKTYARVRGLRRCIISMVPFVPAHLGAKMIGLITSRGSSPSPTNWLSNAHSRGSGAGRSRPVGAGRRPALQPTSIAIDAEWCVRSARCTWTLRRERSFGPSPASAAIGAG